MPAWIARGGRGAMDEPFYDEAEAETLRRQYRAEQAAKANGAGAPPHFSLIRFRDIELGKEPNYLVKGLIPREGLIVVWGPPKCGKTFWAFDLAMHVTLGWDYRGRKVEPGTVVYIACEGERGLAARKEAFRIARLTETDDPPFYLLTTRLDLAAQVDALILDIDAQIPPDRTCAAIIVDTLNRSIRGSESSDEDMTAYVAAADALRERFRCAVIIIHHCGTDATRPRGHTSLTGAADAQIAVKRDAADLVIAKVEWMKDGAEGDEIASRLKVVELGRDDNGEALTSCVVEPCTAASFESGSKKPSLSPAQKRALELLGEAINKAGTVPPASDHIPANASCVTESLWRDYCYHGAISDSDKPGSKRTAFNRSAKALIAARRVGKWGESVWIVP
jgi:hypothetical protein